MSLQSSPSIPMQVSDTNTMNSLLCTPPSAIHACTCLPEKTSLEGFRRSPEVCFCVKRSPRVNSKRHSYFYTYNDVGQRESPLDVNGDLNVRRKCKRKRRSFRSKKSHHLYKKNCEHCLSPQFESTFFQCHLNNVSSESD